MCHKCSGQKFALSFEENKLCRVCRPCYTILHLNQAKDNGNGVGGCNRSASTSNTTPSIDVDQQSLQQIMRKAEKDVLSRNKGLLEVTF